MAGETQTENPAVTLMRKVQVLYGENYKTLLKDITRLEQIKRQITSLDSNSTLRGS